MSLRLDLCDCQVDAIIADSYSGAGLLVVDFTTDVGSVLVHGNRIRSRFPEGETALIGQVGEATVTGNIVTNEVPIPPPPEGTPPLPPSNSLVLNPVISALVGAVLDPVTAPPGNPAVAITGNVFVDPTVLPTPRQNISTAAAAAGLGDWDVLNTVIPSYGATLPMVAGLSPASGPVGATVTVNGTGFAGASQVYFGPDNPVTPASGGTDTSLTVTVPSGTGKVDVMVTTAVGTSQPNPPPTSSPTWK